MEGRAAGKECGIKPMLTAGKWRRFPGTSGLPQRRAVQTSGARKGQEMQVLASGSQAGVPQSAKDKGGRAKCLAAPATGAQAPLKMWLHLHFWGSGAYLPSRPDNLHFVI